MHSGERNNHRRRSIDTKKDTNIIRKVEVSGKVYNLPFPIEVTNEEIADARALSILCLKLIKIAVSEIEQLKAEISELKKEKNS